MKRLLAIFGALALMAGALIPHLSYTEDRQTVLLARTIYALARDDSYAAKLAIGAVAVNRVDDPWFADTLCGVLTEQHQFPRGTRYDADSLAAAHDVLAGHRVLGREALYYQSLKATEPRRDEPVAVIGGFAFYASDAVL